jgi:hypothetical protein
MTDAHHGGKNTRVIAFDPQAFGWGVADGSAPAQVPFAAVLGCADARVPTEGVQQGLERLFPPLADVEGIRQLALRISSGKLVQSLLGLAPLCRVRQIWLQSPAARS